MWGLITILAESSAESLLAAVQKHRPIVVIDTRELPSFSGLGGYSLRKRFFAACNDIGADYAQSRGFMGESLAKQTKSYHSAVSWGVVPSGPILIITTPFDDVHYTQLCQDLREVRV